MALVAETGFRKPLAFLKLRDRSDLCKALRDYYTIIKVLPEINQFGEGLADMNLLEMIRTYPDLMRPLFVSGPEKKVDKGMTVCNTYPGVG